MQVLLFPPRLSFNSHVSTCHRGVFRQCFFGTSCLLGLQRMAGPKRTESLYGTKSSFFFLPRIESELCAARAWMTLPRVVNDLLMLAPSYER
jgi:hypothetical protein